MLRLFFPILFFLVSLPAHASEQSVKFGPQDSFVAILYLCLFLFVGYLCKAIFLRGLMIPSSLIGGLVALAFGPEMLGLIIARLFGSSGNGFLSEQTLLFWKVSPSFLITIVFAGLFLGNHIPSFKQVWNQGSPNLFFGYSLAFGQYAIGLALVVLLLGPVFGINAHDVDVDFAPAHENIFGYILLG